MKLLFPVLVYVLIVRASIKAGYHPIAYGFVYGSVVGFTSYWGSPGLLSVLLVGFAAAVFCAAILWFLERLEGKSLLWWPTFVIGVLLPLWAQAVV